MIKIIKRGTRKTCTCDNCGCVFSYEEEDINVEPFHALDITQMGLIVVKSQCHVLSAMRKLY